MASRSLIAYACVVQEDLIDRGDILAVSLPHESQLAYWSLPQVQISASSSAEQIAQAVANETNRILGTAIQADQVKLLFVKEPRKRNPKIPTSSPNRVLCLVTYTAEQFVFRKTNSNPREWKFIGRLELERMSTFSSMQKKLLRKAKMLRRFRD